jgi:hypothetical protein
VWWQPSWISNQQKQKLCRGSPNDQSRIQFGFNEISGFGKKLFVHFLYGPMLKLCLVVGEHLEILINIKNFLETI